MSDETRKPEEIKADIDVLITELLSARKEAPVLNTGWILAVRGTADSMDASTASFFSQDGLDFVSVVGLVSYSNLHIQRRVNKGHG